MAKKTEERIGVVGLGYVGLPLAVAAARHFDVLGLDNNAQRVEALKRGEDRIQSVDPADLKLERLSFTANPDDLKSCTCIIVAVPTPINSAREPDLACIEHSSRTVGKILQPGMLVVYESTVYPGVTQDICLPILEKESGLTLGQFDLGYSPERVNPSDHEHTVETIMKVVSGHDPECLERVAAIYGTIITAGIHKAPSIKTAEACKIIENVQRDLNIALMNELAKIFRRLGIRTQDVLDAAATKWNFHRYSPGLVGGHCIGVDPYYLTYRALELGYHPEVILAGRRINDNMGSYVAELAIRELNLAGRLPRDANVCLFGMTYKEDVVDFRNTRAIDVARHLQGYGANVLVWEPMAEANEIRERYDLETLNYDEAKDLDAVILINKHTAFNSITLSDLKKKMRTPILVDIKNRFAPDEAEAEGFTYLCL